MHRNAQAPSALLVTKLVTGLLTFLALLEGPSWAQEPLSPRNANYTIEVKLEPDKHMLRGRQVLRWRNIQDQPTDELWFHLYWNAWRNDQSTWIRATRIGARGGRLLQGPREEDWGYLVVERTRLVNSRFGDLDPGVASEQDMAMDHRTMDDPEPELGTRFEAPNDGNPYDRTVMVVDLPAAVAPGEEVEVEMVWRAKVPRTFARTGVLGEHYFIAHWFPKLGVFEGADGWNCHQYHATTEYFSDYGSYDVRLTLPSDYVIGATGRETETLDNGDGTTTHRFQQDDVHGFTWTASPHYQVANQRFEEEGLPSVDMRLLYQKEHAHQVDRHFEATRAALKYYGKWYGPYPYGHITIVDPAFGLRAGGMEYPTIFTAGTRNSRPEGIGSPEGVTIHEAGHQFWYGIVGNNEFEHAWLDEGLNTFSTSRTQHAHYGDTFGRQTYFRPPGGRGGSFITLIDRNVRFSWDGAGARWAGFVASRAVDVPAVPTFHYYPRSAGAISYSKTALWLQVLERHYGWDKLQAVLSTFFDRYKFKHPEPEDLFNVTEEVLGEDMDWFFDQVHYSSVRFDYAVVGATSRAKTLTGFTEGEDGELQYQKRKNLGPGGDGKTYRSEVVIRRFEDGIFPVDVVFAFEDGTQKRHTWDGRERWKLFVEEGPSRLEWAAVDPERVMLLDVDYSNNSRLLKPKSAFPARKWASKWMVWLQDYLHALTFFI